MLYLKNKAMASIVTYSKSVQIQTAELGIINVVTPGSFVNKTIYSHTCKATPLSLEKTIMSPSDSAGDDVMCKKK